MAEKGYAGRIGSTGAQKVNAPYPAGKKSGKGTVKRGEDLRTGSGTGRKK